MCGVGEGNGEHREIHYPRRRKRQRCRREREKGRHVCCNGNTDGRYDKKYQQDILGLEAVTLPSTSPANAAYSVDRLVQIWKESVKEALS